MSPVGKRRRETPTDDVAGLTAQPAVLLLFVGMPNESGAMCWFSSLSQALASLSVVRIAISSRRPRTRDVRKGDALIEGVQRCCNGRGIRPSGDTSSPFILSERTNSDLADIVLPRTGRKAKQQDPIEGLLRAINDAGKSSLFDVFCDITARDLTWFENPHSLDCRDLRDRHLYQAPRVPSLGGTLTFPSVFTINPSVVQYARVSDERDFGIATFFSDSSDCGPRTMPFNLLARYINASLKSSVSSECTHCHKLLQISTMRRLHSCPDVVVAAIQKDVRSVIDAPPLLIHYHGGVSGTSGHYTARVRCVSLGGAVSWLDCNDDSVVTADDVGSKLSGAAFFYERAEHDEVLAR